MSEASHQEDDSNAEQVASIGTLGFVAMAEIEEDVFRAGCLSRTLVANRLNFDALRQYIQIMFRRPSMEERSGHILR